MTNGLTFAGIFYVGEIDDCLGERAYVLNMKYWVAKPLRFHGPQTHSFSYGWTLLFFDQNYDLVSGCEIFYFVFMDLENYACIIISDSGFRSRLSFNIQCFFSTRKTFRCGIIFSYILGIQSLLYNTLINATCCR